MLLGWGFNRNLWLEILHALVEVKAFPITKSYMQHFSKSYMLVGWVAMVAMVAIVATSAV